MSGDATTYVRGKAQERYGPDATFMKDGFSRWAESEAPYRVGGAEKEGEEEGEGAGRHRHRSSKAIHKFAHQEGLSGGSRYRPMTTIGLRQKHRGRKHSRSRSKGSRDSSSDSWNSSDSSSGSSTDSSSSSSSSDSSAGMPTGMGRRRRHRKGGKLLCDTKMVKTGPNVWDQHPETKCEDDGKGRPHRRRRHRRSPSSSSSDSSSSSSSDSSSGEERVVGGRRKGLHHERMRRKRKASESGSEDGNDSSDASDSSGSESSSTSSGDSGCSGAGRKHPGNALAKKLHSLYKRRGGLSGPQIRAIIDQAWDFWYKFSLGGKPPAEWSTVPGGVKDMVNKIHNIWTTLTQYASFFKTLFRQKGMNAVADKMEKFGLGKHRHTKKMAKYFMKRLSGGDAFDDMLSSKGLKTVYDIGKSALKYYDKSGTVEKIDNALHQGYEVAHAIKENADSINAAVDSTKMPDTIKNTVKGTVNAIKGLGKKGKRKPSERNMMVSKLMREKGLTLGEASKQVSAMLKKGGNL